MLEYKSSQTLHKKLTKSQNKSSIGKGGVPFSENLPDQQLYLSSLKLSESIKDFGAVERILKEAGLTTVSKAIGSSSLIYAENLASATESMRVALLELSNAGYENTEVYASLSEKYAEFKDVVGAAEEAISSYINAEKEEYNAASRMNGVVVDSQEAFESYRQDLLDTISASSQVQDALSSGFISSDQIEGLVDAEMASLFPEIFVEISGAAQTAATSIASAASAVEALSGVLDQLSANQKIYNAAIGEMGDPSGSGGISADTLKSIQDALSETEKLTDYVTVQNGVLRLNTEQGRCTQNMSLCRRGFRPWKDARFCASLCSIQQHLPTSC